MMKLLAGSVLLFVLAAGNALHGHELDWLLGCWVSSDGSAREVWVEDSDQSLLGFGVAIDDGKVSFYELLSIRRRDDGALIYTAHPSGQAATSFVATVVKRTSIVFTNPDHDYPQEIAYQRERNRLSATISRLGGVDPNSFDKVACE